MDSKDESTVVGSTTCDNAAALCRGSDKSRAVAACSLPRDARLPINRCNLPAVILGSLTFQRYPAPLAIDGVAELHRDLFARLETEADPAARADVFRDYLTVRFRLARLEDAGYSAHGRRRKRARANWERLIRGWSFDSDNREGAVLKAWVESRFGLAPRFHGAPLQPPGGAAWWRFQEDRARGLYGTNALEAQLDLVYTWAQYELARRHPSVRHITLYRGVNRIADHEVLASGPGRRRVILPNNLSSFTSSRERAGEFGDAILCAQIPVAKIFFHDELMADRLQGEGEFVVIGGVIEVDIDR
ncbi:NAD(+)--dinitrogen-reductase ADP-D-ribosyltransferase [Nitrogeniibacter mangrovi]|uniref:NAD(+)--dinitrogen-reductase ADP-D-ribosyltransferase n=1 Tax=Nitrogeniibacter mangrovi TaxID=2016596 RepID=A0A6C1B750_9RHOO|nr:NAD(+)--dinitrogen-reductase ADP-D-ribosyltransferase [Nitrogeniibacter mangrovi]QID19531.1 NAD(+)--dinitrogen-reductase ADP-D-ribosyltransferase [Nitrogeniibacter mangrovi]